MLSYRPTQPPSMKPNPKVPSYALSPASLPFSTVATAHGGSSVPLAMAALPVPQIAVWSFHLPLHRFVAACIREVSRRHDDDDDVSGSVAGAACSNDGGMEKLLQMFALPTDVTSSSGKDASSKLRLNALLFRGLMEFPIIVVSLSFAVFG